MLLLNKPIHSCDLIVGSIVLLTVFVFQSILATLWSSLGVFSQYNVIFDTDLHRVISKFANGWGTGGFNHPLLSYFFSIPIRIIGWLMTFLGVIDNEIAFRKDIALYVAPLCSSLKALAMYAIFRLLNLNIKDALWAVSFGVLAFSSVVFGATPSSYAVTGCSLALIILATLEAIMHKSKFTTFLMIFSGLFSVGGTVSNIIHFGWMNWYYHLSKKLSHFKALIKAIILSIGILIVTLSLFAILREIRDVDVEGSDLIVSSDFVEQYSKTPYEGLKNFLCFPAMLTQTFLATIPTKGKNLLAIKNNNSIKFELTYNSTRSVWLSFVLGGVMLFVLVGGIVASFLSGGLWRYFGLASAASVLTFGLLYSSWFGINTYLFSQHWQVPTQVLIVSCFNYFLRKSNITYFFILGILIFMLLADIYVLASITEWIKTSFEH